MQVASREYFGKNCNLEHLADSIEEYFSTQKYQVQSAKKDDGWVVQAKKEGILRDLLAADRAFTVTVTGDPSNFKVSFGIGKWFQNLAYAALESLILVPAVLFVEVPITLWSFEIESKFWGFIEGEVELRV
jgi:hypothetical protein